MNGSYKVRQQQDEVEASNSVPAINDGLKRDANFSRNSQNTDYINENDVANQQVQESTIEQQLTDGQERRNRVRRFSSFTSWVPDLQRVWSLRHPLLEKQNSGADKLLNLVHHLGVVLKVLLCRLWIFLQIRQHLPAFYQKNCFSRVATYYKPPYQKQQPDATPQHHTKNNT